jgi:hypothetical protein
VPLPDWVEETKLAEDSYTRRLTSYGRFTWGFLTVTAAILLLLYYYEPSNQTRIEGVALSLLAILLATSLLQNYIVPSPSIPTYQRLAAAVYCAGDELGVDTKEGKKDLKKQLNGMHDLVTEQEPGFKEKDLVFGVALSVLKKLDVVRKKLEAGAKSGIPSGSLPTLQSSLQALGNMIFQSKTINSRDIETIADALVTNLDVITLPTPIPFLQRVPGLLYSLTDQQTLLMEVVVSLFVATLVAFIFNVGFYGGLVVFLPMVPLLDAVERRLRKKP